MPTDSDQPRGRILIADDNERNRELLEAFLEGDGHEILMSSDGASTMQAAFDQQPDLILLDIMMPKLSGYEVCQKLKKDERTKNIPILMVTALKDPGDIEKAVNAGADDFLSKPVHRLELKARVRSLLKVRHLTAERDRLLAYLEEFEKSVDRSQRDS
jgi:CheY-like chemotaxis protein